MVCLFIDEGASLFSPAVEVLSYFQLPFINHSCSTVCSIIKMSNLPHSKYEILRPLRSQQRASNIEISLEDILFLMLFFLKLSIQNIKTNNLERLF